MTRRRGDRGRRAARGRRRSPRLRPSPAPDEAAPGGGSRRARDEAPAEERSPDAEEAPAEEAPRPPRSRAAERGSSEEPSDEPASEDPPPRSHRPPRIDPLRRPHRRDRGRQVGGAGGVRAARAATCLGRGRPRHPRRRRRCARRSSSAGAAGRSRGTVDRDRVGEIVFDDPESWPGSRASPTRASARRCSSGGRASARCASSPWSRCRCCSRPGWRTRSTPRSPWSPTTGSASPPTRAGAGWLEGREDRQLDQDEKARRADHVIRNDGSLEELDREVNQVDRRTAQGGR